MDANPSPMARQAGYVSAETTFDELDGSDLPAYESPMQETLQTSLLGQSDPSVLQVATDPARRAVSTVIIPTADNARTTNNAQTSSVLHPAPSMMPVEALKREIASIECRFALLACEFERLHVMRQVVMEKLVGNVV